MIEKKPVISQLLQEITSMEGKLRDEPSRYSYVAEEINARIRNKKETVRIVGRYLEEDTIIFLRYLLQYCEMEDYRSVISVIQEKVSFLEGQILSAKMIGGKKE